MAPTVLTNSQTALVTQHVRSCQSLHAHRNVAPRRVDSRCKRSHSKGLRHISMQSQSAPTLPGWVQDESVRGQVVDSKGNPADAEQARWASLSPDMLKTVKEMISIRQNIMKRPGLLDLLLKELREGDIDEKRRAAEMLFCVVGQGPGRDAASIQKALDAGLMGAVLGVINQVADLPTSTVRKNSDHQELISVMVSTLAQLTIDSDKTFAQAAVKEGAVISLHNLYSKVSKEGGQQNVVSMLWHWTTLDPDIRQEIIDAGIAELQCDLLGPQHPLHNRVTAADQLSAYVGKPSQLEDEDLPNPRLATQMVDAGAPVLLVEMLSNNVHSEVRRSAAHAIATLATIAPSTKVKIIAAGAFQPVVELLRDMNDHRTREIGAVLLVTLVSGDSTADATAEQIEGAVAFAGAGAIPPLVDMLKPIYPPGTRLVALTAVHIMAHTFDLRVQRALMSAQVVPQIMALTGMLIGRLPWDDAFDDIDIEVIYEIKIKSAELLAMLGIDNKEHTGLLVGAGAVQDMIGVLAGLGVTEEKKKFLMGMLQRLCQTNPAVLDIVNSMRN